MKFSKSKLRKIIKEEFTKILKEDDYDHTPSLANLIEEFTEDVIQGIHVNTMDITDAWEKDMMSFFDQNEELFTPPGGRGRDGMPFSIDKEREIWRDQVSWASTGELDNRLEHIVDRAEGSDFEMTYRQISGAIANVEERLHDGQFMSSY